VPTTALLGEINFANGVILRLIGFEGNHNMTQPHSTIPYKIDILENEIYIFGYARNLIVPGNFYNDINIPFRCKVEINNFVFSDFYLNHTNVLRTIKYNAEEPGFLNSWQGLAPLDYFDDSCSGFFTPEMGVVYKDESNYVQWGMVGYYDTDINTPNTSVFDLHLMNSLVQGECSSLSRDLIINSPLQNIVHDCINLPAFEMPLQITINRFNMNLNSNDCD
jgi:hypothetical protein